MIVVGVMGTGSKDILPVTPWRNHMKTGIDDFLGTPLADAVNKTIAKESTISLDDGLDDITLLKQAKSLLLRALVKQLREETISPMGMSVVRGLLQDNSEAMSQADNLDAEKAAMEEVLRRRREDMSR